MLAQFPSLSIMVVKASIRTSLAMAYLTLTRGEERRRGDANRKEPVRPSDQIKTLARRAT